MKFSVRDTEYMAEALRLAERGRYTVSPNPCVGCVAVNDGKIIGRGWHQQAGQGHAEINAFADARNHNHSLSGSTLYVTLEPCSIDAKTPPCVDAIIDAGVARVVTAMTDPNPGVSGAGHKKLLQAGIQVDTGLLESQAANLNKGFSQRMEKGLPYVTCKLAASLDGRTAMASGESQWITSPPARQRVQQLRAASCAIVTGVATIRRDNPQYTVREVFDSAERRYRQPLLLVLDTQLQTPSDAAIFAVQQREIVIACAADTNSESYQLAAKRLRERGAHVVEFPSTETGIDIASVLAYLAKRECNEVLLEAGARLAGAFLQAQCIDELQYFVAPKLMGGTAKPSFDVAIEQMENAVELDVYDVSAVGPDWLFSCRPRYTD